jgi:hypothetical protein
MISVSAEMAAQNKFLIEGPGPKAWIHNYIDEGRTRPDGSPRQAGDPVPMIYLVDQEPNSTIQMHFHQVDQFQVFVGGSGSMGRHPLAPITVHYTNAFTGYGPLSAGPDGLQYLTIRAQWDPGLRPLPEAKDERPPAGTFKTRQHTTAALPVASNDALLRLPALTSHPLFDANDSRSCAWRLTIPPYRSFESPASRSAPSVVIVCAGFLEDQRTGGPMSCHFVHAGEAACFNSGAAGAELLILQFDAQTNANKPDHAIQLDSP